MTTKDDSPLVYLDANVFIDLVEGGPDLAGPLKRLFEELRGRGRPFATSEITIAEVLAPSRVFGEGSPQLKERYLDILMANEILSLRPISRSILLRTVEVRALTGHKLPDAIHCATANDAACRYLVSRDQRMRRLSAGMIPVDGSAGSVETLIGTLRA